MGMPGIYELLIIAFIVVILFGTKKLPQLLGGLGEGIAKFKRGVREGDEDE